MLHERILAVADALEKYGNKPTDRVTRISKLRTIAASLENRDREVEAEARRLAPIEDEWEQMLGLSDYWFVEELRDTKAKLEQVTAERDALRESAISFMKAYHDPNKDENPMDLDDALEANDARK